VSDPRNTQLRAALAHHRPRDPEEVDAVATVLALLAGDADPFSRGTLPTHVTASAIVHDPEADVVLLHLHRRLDRWLQPGGHVDPGERPEDAAVRETLEETGVAVDHPVGGPVLLHVDEHPGPDDHVHLDLRYLLLTDRAAPPAGAGERTGDGPGPSLRWLAPAAAAADADRSLARALDALVARRG